MATHASHSLRLTMEFSFGIEDITNALLKRYAAFFQDGEQRLADPTLHKKAEHQQKLLLRIIRDPRTVRSLMVKRFEQYFDREFHPELKKSIQELCQSVDPLYDAEALTTSFILPHVAQLDERSRAYFEAPESSEVADDIYIRTEILEEAIDLKLTDARLQVAS